MNRTSADIEREVEATRGDLDRTVEALREKITPGQLLDEAMASLRGTGASDMVSNLGVQVRENPLPLAMIGAGLAWLMFGRGAGGHLHMRRGKADGRFDAEWGEDYSYEAGGIVGGANGLDPAGGRVSQAATRVKDAARSGAAHASETLSGARRRVSSAASGARDGAAGAREQAAYYGGRARSAFMDTLERDPLIVGALGVAVGTVIAAAIPPTPAERRYVGPMRDRVLDEGRVRARQGVETAKHAAATGFEAARDEADRQGLAVDSLVDKARQTAKAGLDAARNDVRGQGQADGQGQVTH